MTEPGRRLEVSPELDWLYEWALKSVPERPSKPIWMRGYPLFEKLRADPRRREFLKTWNVPA
jgi:hypothetical protein